MEFKIENMTCGGCARSVSKVIQSVDADAKVDADPATRMIKVETSANPADVRQALAQAGYPSAS
ncbi:heavy-metal-associated domain-containing protein [Rhizobium chutanense]|uniref:Copper chaperone n=1 Tax=Rhizobium chutanense TaxID=2035448 RepID=A0A3S0QLF4_9HYPH|nr:heavy-metal-associated domain-containing protein [Rhizobium chutanense]RUM06173.1 copper chaperone [Rhizobium chutanense]